MDTLVLTIVNTVTNILYIMVDLEEPVVLLVEPVEPVVTVA